MQRTLLTGLSLATVFVSSVTPLQATDWPHWLGPAGNNRTTDAAFQPDLQKYSTAWKAEIGKGFSSVSVVGGRAYVSGHDGSANETVFCFDAATGKVIWKVSFAAELLPRMHAGGPNATVTVLGDHVFALSKDGQLLCLTADTGTKVWEAKLPAAMGVEVPQWGFGSSPVVSGNQLFVSAGKLIAFDLKSGKTIWVSSADRPAAYATPVPFKRAGKDFVAAINGNGLSIHGADGAELAHREIKAGFNLLAPTPLVVADGNQIFVSVNSSSELLNFDGTSLTPAWTTTELKNALNNSVIADGVIYGIDGRQGTPACRLMAMNLADGKVLWTKDNFGYGTTIGVGESLLALTENGELVSARLSPASYQELGRQQILGKTCWTTPTVAAGRIYARNDQGDLVCLAVK